MYETSVHIGADPGTVWQVWMDVERWPEWTSSIRAVSPLGAGDLRVGSRVRIEQPRLPAAVWEVTELEAGRRFAWRSSGRGVTTVASHEVVADSGGSGVTLRVEQSGPLLFLALVLFGGLTRRFLRLEADGLKARCESQ